MRRIPRQHDGNAAGGQRLGSPLSKASPDERALQARKRTQGCHAGLYARRPRSSPIKACGASQLRGAGDAWMKIAAAHSPLMITRDRPGNARR